MLTDNRLTAAFNSDIAKFARGMSTSLVGRIGGRTTHIVGQILLARLLGPEAFGLYAIGWTLLSLIGLISPLGLDKGVIRYASLYRGKDVARLRGVLFQSVGLAILSGIGSGYCFYLTAPWLAELIFKKPELTPIFRWFSPAFVLFAGLKVLAAITRVSQQMKWSVYAEDLAQPAANLVLFLGFYRMGWGLPGAIAASVGSFAIATILAAYSVAKTFPEIFLFRQKATFAAKELITFSLPASFGAMLTVSIVWIDRLLVGLFCPPTEVGVYQAASQSSMLFAVILGAVGAIFAPMIVDLHQKGEMQRLEELYRVSTKWGLYLSLPLFLVVCFGARDVMKVAFGAPYEHGALPLAILTFAHLVHVGTGEVGYLLMMTGYQNRWLIIAIAALFIDVVLNWILITHLGILGAALGTTCIAAGLVIFGLRQVKFCLGIWPYDKRYNKGIIATIFTILLLVVAQTLEINSSLIRLFVMSTISIGAFTGALLFLGLDKEDQQLFRGTWLILRTPVVSGKI